MPLTARRSHDEAGASAMLVALSLVLLLGMAALAIDIGFGFNERRQDVAAADTGVMAGAVSVVFNEGNDPLVAQVLDKVRSNLDTVYTDSDWQALWRSCADPVRLNFDPGTGIPVTLSPLPEPSAWGGAPGATLDCISQGSSYLRVRVPDQLVNTNFARIWGTTTIATSAAAVALIEPASDLGGLIPFGISGSAGAGELCLKSSGSGIAFPPCSGPSAGSFGEINSEIFGDFFGSPDCGNPNQPELEQNIALGVDHFVALWPGTGGVSQGDPHPGDVAVDSYGGVSHDACDISGGIVQPAFGSFPVNTMRVRTGFTPGAVENGMMSDSTYLGIPSRLQQTCTASACTSSPQPTRDVVKRRQGANETIWDLDNVGPWSYLTGNGLCDVGTYSGLTTDQKVTRFTGCLQGYTGTADIFAADINQSPRFAWAPQYWFEMSTSGLSWQPVVAYRMVFLGGAWFNCSSGTCGAIFYPDDEQNAEVCDPGGGSNCNLLNLDQISAWMFPDQAIPDSVRFAFPGGQSPFLAGLFR